MRAPGRCLVLAVLAAAACGSSQRAPAPEPRQESALPSDDDKHPRKPHGDPCASRTDVAMACWDRAASTGTLRPATPCETIRDDTRNEIAARDTAAATTPSPSGTSCLDSLAESCLLGCALQRGGTETRDHFYMLMTSPPP